MKRTRYATNAQLCAALTVALASVGATGWLVDIPWLTQIHPSYIPIAPSTVLAFALLGAGVYLEERWPDHALSRWWNRIGTTIVLLFSALIIARSADWLHSDLEALLFGSHGALEGIPIGRMSLATAVLLLLCALARTAKILRGDGTGASLPGLLGTLVTLAGFVLLLAYAYGTPLMYGMGAVPPALITSLCFLIFGIALIANNGIESWPLREFTGPSVRATLLRIFPPIVVCIVLVEHSLEHFGIGPFLRMNPAIASALWAVLIAVATGGGIVFVARKLGTALDETQRALEECVEESRTLLDATHDIAMLLEADGTIVAANREAGNWLGGAPEELVGHVVYEYMPAEVAEVRRQCIERVFRSSEPALLEDASDGTAFSHRCYPIFDSAGTVTRLALFTRHAPAKEVSV